MVAAVAAGTVVAVAIGLTGAAVAGPAGAAVAALPGLVLGLTFGRAVAAATPYDLTSVTGARRLLVDLTWSLVNTVAGAVFLAVNLARGNRVDPEAGRHSGSVILVRPFLRGYATTIGTVQAGTRPHLRRHEDTHVLQARLFGPLYLPLVVAHYVVVTLVPYWLLYHDRARQPIDGFRAYFRRGVYRHTWHELWAYSVGDGRDRDRPRSAAPPSTG
ncbi:MAG: glycine zipper family protein [Micromonosporaceae bacterium]|mgnify:CR=1 FL=1|jgi:hypothetical protein